VPAKHAQEQANFIEHYQSEPRPAAVSPIADSDGACFEFCTARAVDKHNGGIKIPSLVALDQRLITSPNLRVTRAATY